MGESPVEPPSTPVLKAWSRDVRTFSSFVSFTSLILLHDGRRPTDEKKPVRMPPPHPTGEGARSMDLGAPVG